MSGGPETARPSTRIALRLVMAAIALAAGITAVVVAVELVRTVL